MPSYYCYPSELKKKLSTPLKREPKYMYISLLTIVTKSTKKAWTTLPLKRAVAQLVLQTKELLVKWSTFLLLAKRNLNVTVKIRNRRKEAKEIDHPRAPVVLTMEGKQMKHQDFPIRLYSGILQSYTRLIYCTQFFCHPDFYCYFYQNTSVYLYN